MSRSRTNASYVKSLNPKTIADESRGLIETLNSKVTTAAAGAAAPTKAQIALMHGDDGSTLRPVKVNATGQLEIDIEDVTIGTDGLALEAKQDTMINATVRDINNTAAIGDGSSQASSMCLGYDRTNGQGRSILVDSGGKVEVNASMTAGHGLATEAKQDDLLNATNRAINNTDSIGDGSTNATAVALGYDRSGGKGRALLVDGDGHLQVDVLSSTGADTRIKGNDGADGSGTDRIILTDGNGALIVDPSKEGLVSANGTTTAMHTMMLATNDGTNLRTVACDANGVLTVDGSASTQPISASALPLPSGASTAAKQPALGTAGTASADVLSVQGISSMTPLVVDGSGSTQPVSGTVAVSGTVSVDGSGVTQPVSAAALPLPSGAATSALQSTGNTSLATIAGDTTSIDGKITACNTGAVTVSASALPSGASTAAKQPALGTAGTASADVLSVQGISSMTPLVVDGSASTQPVSGTVTANAGSGTFAVSAASLPLPSGAATEATLSNAEGHLGTIDTSTAGIVASHYAEGDTIGGTDTGVLIMGRNGTNAAKPIHITNNGDVEVEIADFVKGQAAKAASFPVVIASDQDTLAVEQTYAYGSEYTIINAQTIANGDTVTSAVFEIQSVKNIQAILSLSLSAGGSTSFDVGFEGSLNNSDFFAFPDSTIFASGDAIVSTEKAGIVPVRYMKVKITNNHGSGSHTFTVKGSVLGATLAAP